MTWIMMHRKKWIGYILGCILSSIVFVFLHMDVKNTKEQQEVTIALLGIYSIIITIFGFAFLKKEMQHDSEQLIKFVYQTRRQYLYQEVFQMITINYVIAYLISLVVVILLGKCDIYFIIVSFLITSLVHQIKVVQMLRNVFDGFDELIQVMTVLMGGLICFLGYTNMVVLLSGCIVSGLGNISTYIFVGKWRYRDADKKSKYTV